MGVMRLCLASTRRASVLRGRSPCASVGTAQRGVRAMTRRTRSGPTRRSRFSQSFSVKPGLMLRMTRLGRYRSKSDLPNGLSSAIRARVPVVSRCSGAKSTKVPGGEPAPICMTSAGTCAAMPSRSTASGTARSSVAPGGGVAVSRTGSFSTSDKMASASVSVLSTVLPPGRVIRTWLRLSSSSVSADRVSRSRQSRGYFALAILPVVRLTTARRRSPARPVRVTVLTATSWPSIDLTGYRRSLITIPTMA